MKEKTRYTDEPMRVGRIIPNFLPPPDKLIFKEDAVKVTITLSAKSVYFFKTEAAKRGVQYQRMIRRLLDAYVEAFEPEGSGDVTEQTKGQRVEQTAARYRKAAARRKSRPARASAAAKRFIGSDKRPGDVARNTKDVRHLKGIVPKPARAVPIEEMNRTARKAGAKR